MIQILEQKQPGIEAGGQGSGGARSYLEYRVAEGEGLGEFPQFGHRSINHRQGGLPLLYSDLPGGWKLRVECTQTSG